MASNTSLCNKHHELFESNHNRWVLQLISSDIHLIAPAGLVADFAKNRLKVPRSYCLVLVSLFFLISQITASRVQHIKDLWVASGLLGLAHGSVFSLFPTICIEWFGLRTCPVHSRSSRLLTWFLPSSSSPFFPPHMDTNTQPTSRKIGAMSHSPPCWEATSSRLRLARTLIDTRTRPQVLPRPPLGRSPQKWQKTSPTIRHPRPPRHQSYARQVTTATWPRSISRYSAASWRCYSVYLLGGGTGGSSKDRWQVSMVNGDGGERMLSGRIPPQTID